MARLFDDAASEYLKLAAAIGGRPLTLAAWGRSDDATIDQAIFALGHNTNTKPFYMLSFAGAAGGDPVRLIERDNASTLAFCDTTAGFGANAWHHAAARAHGRGADGQRGGGGDVPAESKTGCG